MKKLLFSILFLTSSIFSSTNFYEQGIDSLEKNNTLEASEYFIKSSKNGNAKAMYKLGLIYEKSDVNNTLALAWYIKAKEHGNIKAKYNLGVLSCKMKTYEYLDDFETYATDATKLIQYDLAVCFSHKGDKQNALKWFTKAANKGNVKAQYRVASLINDKTEKIQWLKKAANNKHVEAQFELGKTMFKLHKIKKAKHWLKKAKKNGSEKASVYLKRINELGL